MEELSKFKQLGLSDATLAALKKKGFEEPTPIQMQVIPLLLAGEVDVIGQAQTGTGKTAAFGLPLIEKLAEAQKHVQVIILVPTRELALQVSEEINSLKGTKRLNIAAIYGGQSIDAQLDRLRRGVDIVVGTPGRVLDHLERKSLKLDKISRLILDEADEMLDMGFIDDVEEIIRHTNPERKIMLFSATMPERIISLAKRYMKNYKVISAKSEQLTTALTEQIYFEVQERDKFEALCRIIDVEEGFYGLIFCRTKIDVDMISRKLMDRGYGAEALHGDVSQYQRERILDKFKKRLSNALVATDVAARGIDINNLTHVINYSLPQDPESYVHRIGRTGRAGKQGTAITFVSPDEYRKLLFIKRISKAEIKKGSVPKVKDVINTKRARIKNEIIELIKSGEAASYVDMAKEMLEGNNPEEVLAAMIRQSFKGELDEKNYNEIREVSVDRQGTSRLFVALGKVDNLTPAKLVTFIRQETSVDERKIDDVRIFENFSFITVPFNEAEIILEAFRQQSPGRRPLVDRAKEKTEDGRGSSGGSRGGRPQGGSRPQSGGGGRWQRR
jgi:ATP-dependent RNA helicase DeaD